MTGCTDVSCAIELGKILNSERVIIGPVGLVGETYSITARIVDVETAEIVAVADYMYKGMIDNLLTTGIPSVVNELMYCEKQKIFTYEPVTGKIAFCSDRDGNWEIYTMDADGSNQTNLTNN